MFFHSENIGAAIDHAEGLHSFKDCLAIMERHRSRAEAKICKRNNYRFLPMPIMKITNEHMIGKIFSKLQILEIYFMKPGVGRLADLDFCSQFHCAVFSLFY